MNAQTSVVARTGDLTMTSLLRHNATRYPRHPALTSLDDPATTLTWSELRDRVAALCRGLADLGLRTGDRMVIMSPNRPEHLLCDLAAVHLGAVPCTAYSTLSPNQIRYLAEHSAATIVVLAGTEELDRWAPVLATLPRVRRVVVLDTDATPTGDERFLPYTTLFDRGRTLHESSPDVFERLSDERRPDDPLSLIYTSGTTGLPKGVVLSHRNAIHEAFAVRAVHDFPPHPRNIAYLPLAHIAERELSLYLPVVNAGHVHTLADPGRIMEALVAVRPETLFGVPRVWEKLVAGLKNLLATLPAEEREALLTANELLQQGYKLRSTGTRPPADLADRIAETDRTVLAPIRQRLGLDELVVTTSGAAALPIEILYFLAGLGIEIHEVWGLSETTGAVTSNHAGAFRAGTVGRPLPDVDVRVAEDGELLVRGPIVFSGYLAEDGSVVPATDADGWFATGDIGSVDAGYVTITDRKKELIITSGGKNIAPTRIETLLTEHPLVGQAVAIGDSRPYVTALVVLDDEIAPAWAASKGIEERDPAALAAHPVVRDEIDRVVQAANRRLSRAEQVKRHLLLTHTWSPETGELTPTLKLKRRVITDRYESDIEALYSP